MEPAPLKTLVLKDGERQLDILVRDDSSSRLVARELFRNRVYPVLQDRAAPRAILDVGAFLGLSAAYFRMVYPDAFLCCVEPDPDSYAVLARNAASIGRCEAFNLGLLDQDGAAAFHAAGIPVLSSLYATAPAHVPRHQIEVRLRHAGLFFDEALSRLSLQGFDLLKIDTEGAELPILRALGARLVGIGVIQFEFHSHDDRRAIDDLLSATHRLVRGTIEQADRGTLTYERLPPA